jgi:hypothetical protein
MFLPNVLLGYVDNSSLVGKRHLGKQFMGGEHPKFWLWAFKLCSKNLCYYSIQINSAQVIWSLHMKLWTHLLYMSKEEHKYQSFLMWQLLKTIAFMPFKQRVDSFCDSSRNWWRNTLLFWQDCCDIPAQGLIGLIRILISTSCNFFSRSPSLKTPKLSVLGLERWVTDREVLPGCAWVRTKCAGKTCVGLWGIF